MVVVTSQRVWRGRVDGRPRRTIPVGQQTVFVLQWDQPFFSVSGGTGSQNDLDMYILNDPPTTIVAQGNSYNIRPNGSGDAIEIFAFTNPGPATTYNILINKFAGTAPG